MSSNSQIKFVLDINILLDVAAATGPINQVSEVTDFYAYGENASRMSAFANIAAAYGSDMVVSDLMLATFEHKLRHPSTDKFTGNKNWDAFTGAEAANTAAVHAAFVTASHGTWLRKSTVIKHLAQARALVPANLYGSRHGQVDHEDLTVLATALAAGVDCNLVAIVTDDRGLERVVREHFSGWGITAMSSERAAAMTANVLAA